MGLTQAEQRGGSVVVLVAEGLEGVGEGRV